MVNVTAETGWEFALLSTEDFCEHLLQNQARADACDHWSKKASTLPPNGPKYDQLKNNPEERSTEDRSRKSRYRANVKRKHDLQADIGSNHEHLAMGEMNEPKDTKHQRIADRNERVGAAKHQSIGDLLQQHDQLR